MRERAVDSSRELEIFYGSKCGIARARLRHDRLDSYDPRNVMRILKKGLRLYQDKLIHGISGQTRVNAASDASSFKGHSLNVGVIHVRRSRLVAVMHPLVDM